MSNKYLVVKSLHLLKGKGKQGWVKVKREGVGKSLSLASLLMPSVKCHTNVYAASSEHSLNMNEIECYTWAYSEGAIVASYCMIWRKWWLCRHLWHRKPKLRYNWSTYPIKETHFLYSQHNRLLGVVVETMLWAGMMLYVVHRRSSCFGILVRQTWRPQQNHSER